jgi:L-asparaginase / beta-aspartyl-peptidase
MTIALIVHGGARELPSEEIAANRSGCLAALRAGWAILERGGAALDAVEAAIRALEDDPTFNAGVGAALNADGEVELEAAIMESSALRCGAVAGVGCLRHPISVARRILDAEPNLLISRGAERFAEEQGAELCHPSELITDKQRRALEQKQEGHDTVGCVALDDKGVLATGASTGGLIGQHPGRVGDTALIGCGLYATADRGACAMSGVGETIIQVALARTVVGLLDGDRHPDDAASKAIDILTKRVRGEGGCIVIDRQGRVGWAHNSRDMVCAYRTSEMPEPAVFTRKAILGQQ